MDPSILSDFDPRAGAKFLWVERIIFQSPHPGGEICQSSPPQGDIFRPNVPTPLLWESQTAQVSNYYAQKSNNVFGQNCRCCLRRL